MNKKQIIIILTLVVLIACAGVLASMGNSPLSVSESELGKNSLQTNTNVSNKGKTNFFTEQRLLRDQSALKTTENLKSMIDDKSVSQTSKNNAQSKYVQVSLANNHEQRIESILKTKGFADALCFVDDDKVTVIVKSKATKLTDAQTRIIKNVIVDETKIGNVEISVQQ